MSDLTIDDIPDDMIKRIQQMFHNTWNVIAGDWLSMHKDVIEEPCTVENAVEGVCDADRYVAYGEDKEAAETFGKLGWEDMKKLCRPVMRGYANRKGLIR